MRGVMNAGFSTRLSMDYNGATLWEFCFDCRVFLSRLENVAKRSSINVCNLAHLFYELCKSDPLASGTNSFTFILKQ